MTGWDVLRRCSSYKRDMERLQMRLGCARDAAMRVTRSMDTTGHGGGEDKMGEYAAKADAIEREMRTREQRYAREVAMASRLLEQFDPLQGGVLYMRMVQGMSVQQISAQLYYSKSTVKGWLRQGRETLMAIEIAEK